MLSYYKPRYQQSADVLRLPYKNRTCQNCRFLAILTGSSISHSSTYILFLAKLQKRQILDKGFALFENDITGSESTFKMTDT